MNRRLPAPAPVGALCAALTLAAACGDGAMEAPTAEIRDSAGVRVVLNAPPNPDADPVWTVVGEPEVEIGVVDGDPEYQLFRVSGAVVLSDERIAVANGGSREVRLYDSRGQHVWTAGGEGDGPGEFRSVRLVDRFGRDSIMVFDGQLDRASVFDTSGRFVRSFRIGTEEERSPAFPVGVLSDARLLVRTGSIFRAGEESTRVDRAPTRLALATTDGESVRSLGEFAGSERFVWAGEGFLSVRSLPFGRGLLVANVEDRIAIGNNDAFSIRVLDPSGTPVHVVRQEREPEPLGEGDYAAYAEDQLAGVEDESRRARFRTMLAEMPRHETLPAYEGIRLDRVGRLWVEEYRRPGDEQPVWQVFDPEGVLAARVRTPEGMNVLDIGDDYLLGLVRDELDVERMRLHRLVRSPSPPAPEG